MCCVRVLHKLMLTEEGQRREDGGSLLGLVLFSVWLAPCEELLTWIIFTHQSGRFRCMDERGAYNRLNTFGYMKASAPRLR